MCSLSVISIKQGSKGLNCVVLHVGSSCTEVVLNNIPAFLEHFNPSCRCAIWQCCIATCFTQSLKTFLCTKTLCHFNFDPGTLLVNMILGCTHCPYERQRFTHCSRLTEYCRRWLPNSSNSPCSCPQKWQLSNSPSSCDSNVPSTFYLTFVY